MEASVNSEFPVSRSSSTSSEKSEVSTDEARNILESDAELMKDNMNTIVAGSNSPRESSMNSSHEKHLTTAGNTGWPEHTPLDGPGHEHGAHYVDTLSSTTSVHVGRKLLFPKDEEDAVRHILAAFQRDHQDQMDRLQEKLRLYEDKIRQLEDDLGRRQFLEDREKRKKVLQSSTAYGNKQNRSCTADGATFMGEEENLLGRAVSLQQSSFSLQQRLLEISNSLSEAELKQMKFLARPKVNGFRLAKIREGFELFEELETTGELSRAYVRQLLEGIQRYDLLIKLDTPLLNNTESGSHHPTGKIPSRDNSGRNLSSARGNSDDSGGDMAVNAEICDGSSVQSEPSTDEHARLPDSSNGGFLSNDSCSSATSSSTGSSASSALIAQPLRVGSNSSSSTSYDACDGSPSTTLDHHSAVDSSSGEEENLDEADAECESGEIETAEACAARDGLTDSDPVSSPDRAQSSSNLEHMRGLKQEALPDGDMSVGQNGSSACGGVGKDSTVDQSVCDISTQSNEWQRLGARPKDRPIMKRVPVEPSLVPVPQEVAGPVAHGLAGAFLARHSQDESFYQGSAEQVLPGDSSSQGASYVDNPNKAKPYFGDCQVASRPDAHSRSWFVAGANTEANIEPHGADAAVPSANSGGSMLNRGSCTDAVESMDNSLIALEQRVDCIIGSLEAETNPSSASSAFRRRPTPVIARESEGAAISARSRWSCTCAYGEQVAEDRTPICGNCYKQQYLGPASLRSRHNECSYCRQLAFSGFVFLPCIHKVHMECVIRMIQNGVLNCPICGRAFLY